ncbi:SPARC-related modular calcium-binding protein 2 isoform X2 [Phlebotomus papatasi]|uniref:SPARC-related modular calcium-binding protein 2 isoform X2 n=1 Tax=Phlebotomus papatasi TaxID=29031 RepID=UPI002483EBBE|nr:SPARC-related modular calcium-binding protein 2 isoform X2 [Phlebotomus papatasi]XP_055702239.1 SPARC-related modular calcium-binding protein 2 isoform X2 [Phlebotomus papatasi]XP_055702240.1 SPARC-related modular calcium-binding protein 2 isoform X2 [Phlebotomus papatasi]
MQKMLVSVCFLLSTLVHLGVTSSTLKGTEPTISECAAKGGECNESRGRPVCGTDNQTYPTRCHLLRAQCSGHQVSLKHRGKCKNECAASRNYALAHRSAMKFVPRCRADGTYAAVQCLEDDCWCVTPQGKPIRNTTVKGVKPICTRPAKVNTRRSPDVHLRMKKPCSKMDKVQFNANLVKMFHNEFVRYNKTSGVSDNRVLDWKFTTLDRNFNSILDKNEFRELKKLVKKIVKPKRCARAFGKFCDEDLDEKLSKSEWSNCFTKDTSNSASGHAGPTIVDAQEGSLEVDEDDDYYEDEFPGSMNALIGGVTDRRLFPMNKKPGFLLQGKTTLQLSGDGDALGRDGADGESDCLADRAAALDEQKSGTTALYVPECTPDGRYQRVQCYRSTGYCWCVHEDTGKNIPGTSTKDKKPQCDAIYSPTRPMKGCPEGKKLDFLRELKLYLKDQLIITANSATNNTKWNNEDEKLATLSFVILDKNKNKVWERREWKTFRELVMPIKALRKCGKKLPRYCDVNNDREITLSEWLNCLQTTRTSVSLGRSITNDSKPLQSKFRGPNPLESYLKSD